MKTETCKYLYKGEIQAANRRAIAAGYNAIEPDYVEKLPSGCRFPIFFTLPIERGWVRCEIGTASDGHAKDFMPLWLDLPREIYENLHTIKVPVGDEGEECPESLEVLA